MFVDHSGFSVLVVYILLKLKTKYTRIELAYLAVNGHMDEHETAVEAAIVGCNQILSVGKMSPEEIYNLADSLLTYWPGNNLDTKVESNLSVFVLGYKNRKRKLMNVYEAMRDESNICYMTSHERLLFVMMSNGIRSYPELLCRIGLKHAGRVKSILSGNGIITKEMTSLLFMLCKRMYPFVWIKSGEWVLGKELHDD